MLCEKCGAKNSNESSRCSVCGNKLLQSDSEIAEEDIYNINKKSNVSEYEQINSSGITNEELKLYIGSESSYYMARWSKVVNSIYKTDWNWAAFFFAFCWMAYRKMYVESVVLGGIYVLILAIFPDTGAVGGILIALFAGLIGNWMYYESAEKEIRKIKASVLDEESRRHLIINRGGTNIVYAAVYIIVYVAAQVLLEYFFHPSRF